MPAVYGGRLDGVEIKTTLAGFVPDALTGLPMTSLAGRAYDVVYRGRPVPFWLGRLGQDKVRIGQGFYGRSERLGLRTDIAWGEVDRIYGEEWYRFLADSRTTLGTESGSSIVDFDGSVHSRTDAYIAGLPTASFAEVERDVLAPYEGNAIISVISPRAFEAAALGTVMVNFAGRYSDVIEPWVHYLPLDKDFANFDEVVEHIRDDAALEDVRRRAYTDLVASGTFGLKAFIQEFDDDVDRLAPMRARAASRSGSATAVLRQPQRQLRDSGVVARAVAHRTEHGEQRLIEGVAEVLALERLAKPLLGEGRQSERLHVDLVRLAALTQAQRGTLKTGTPEFRVEPSWERDGSELWFVSRSVSSLDGLPQLIHTAEVVEALRAGRLDAVYWNHAPVGLGVAITGGPATTSLVVGHYVASGIHRFDALVALARRLPDDVAAALGAALVAPAPPAPPPKVSSSTLRRTRFALRHPRMASRLLAAKVGRRVKT